MKKKKEILSIEALSLSVQTAKGRVKPLRGVTLSLYEGELLVILGESGAGKSLLVKAVMGMLPEKAKIEEGEIRSLYTGREMSMILQDPKKLLDPTMTLGRQVMESLKYAGVSKRERKEAALKILSEVSMDDPKRRFFQYVHELSGGLAQRGVIAVELARKPKLLLADEPTTALDDLSEEKIISLIRELTDKKSMTTVLITHSLKVAKAAADRIAVMYAGRIIEVGKKDEVLKNPLHPYTRALIKAASLLPDKEGNLYQIKGANPRLWDVFPGDPFAKRNPHALVIDHLKAPPLMKVTDSHYVASWLLDARYERYGENPGRMIL